MRKTKLTGGFAGFMALLISFGVLAEGHEEERGAISDVWIFSLKRGMEDDFSAAMKEHMAVRKEIGEPASGMNIAQKLDNIPGSSCTEANP